MVCSSSMRRGGSCCQPACLELFGYPGRTPGTARRDPGARAEARWPCGSSPELHRQPSLFSADGDRPDAYWARRRDGSLFPVEITLRSSQHRVGELHRRCRARHQRPPGQRAGPARGGGAVSHDLRRCPERNGAGQSQWRHLSRQSRAGAPAGSYSRTSFCSGSSPGPHPSRDRPLHQSALDRLIRGEVSSYQLERATSARMAR